MARYIGRRLLQMIPVFIGATLLIYFMVFSLPGDPIIALGGERGLSAATEARLRADFNLDKPFIVQYLLYLKGIFTLDFGTSFSGRPVMDVVRQAFPVTIKLAFMAIIFEATLGIVFGLIAGMRTGKLFEATVLIISLIVIAVPTFV